MSTAARLRIALLGLALVAVVVLALRMDAEPGIAPGSTLVVELEGSYLEAPSPPLLARVLGAGHQPFGGLLSTFARAERDERIATVLIHVRNLEIGWGKAQELRAAIGRLRAAGRHTVAYLDPAGYAPALEYYVATAADEVHLPRGGAMPLVGLAAEHLYLGGLWERLGVEIEVARVGRYKTAAESLAGDRMSEAAREMADSLLDSTFDQFVAGIAEGRGRSADEIRAAIDAGPVRADELLALGLIDGVAHRSELEDRFGEVVEPEVFARVSAETLGFDPKAQLAVVYASGSVVGGTGTVSRTGDPVAASRTVSRALLDAAEDPTIDGIVLRIDSPGGSATASEEIWDALRRARESGKPVIASLSDVGASGGYYVAVGTDAVVAPPMALTGSIGVFALRPVVGGALEKVGVHVEPLKRGAHADFLLSAEPLSPGASARLQALVEDTYALFLERVAQGRGIETEAVDDVAQGRVWTGAQAAEAGLVDELGGLHAAVERAKQALALEAGDDVALVPYPQTPTLSQQLGELLNGRLAAGTLAGDPVLGALAEAGGHARWLRELQAWLALPAREPLLVSPLLVEIR